MRRSGADHTVQHHPDNDAPLNIPPQPYPHIPRSCAFREGTGADTELLVLVAFGDACVRPAKSMEMLIGDGHSPATSAPPALLTVTS